jgi:hypothetical protein
MEYIGFGKYYYGNAIKGTVVVLMSLYRLQSRDLKGLDSNKAVDFFRRLLWAEASRIHVEGYLIDAPDCINIGDGGLDAVIYDAHSLSYEIIPSGSTGFQVKSSDLEPAACRKELYNSKGQLKPAIKRLLDSNGTYVLVLFEEMPPETMKRDRENAILDELRRVGYLSPKIRVYTINQIITFAEKFPALVSWLKGHDIACLPYEKWANNKDVVYPRNYVEDNQRASISNEIRQILRATRKDSIIIRVAGLSGLGKTRLIFEALATDDLRNRVLYTTAGGFKDSSQLNTLLVDDSQNAILVVDECSAGDHDYLANRFTNIGSRIALITISNEPMAAATTSIYYQLNPMRENDIEKILMQENKELPQNIASRLANLAEGYPSFAILLLKNYFSNPENTDDFMAIGDLQTKKLISGSIDENSDWYVKTRSCLMALALFGKVGFHNQLASEAQYASNLVGTTWDEFQKVIREQKNSRIVQGEYYIWVTPFPLAVHLLREWWEIYGNNRDFKTLIENMPPELLDRFVSQLPFVTTKSGKKLVEALLSNIGIFADGKFLQTERGGNFFLKLSEADPATALSCLKRTIGSWNKEQLMKLTTGRRQIVWSLEKMAVWGELFSDAVKLLLVLGEAENEQYANNASGVFADLFVPGYGSLSPTEVSLEDRYNILAELINDGSFERRKLVLRAFKRTLQRSHFSRMIGAEYQGSRRIPELWTPKSAKELIDHYTRVWTYLDNNLESFSEEIRKDASKVLLNSARELNTVELAQMITSSLRKMSTYTWINKSEILATVSLIVHYDSKRMLDSVKKLWTALGEELTGNSFPELLKRFVMMDLLEDYFHGTEKYDTTWVNQQILNLANQVKLNLNLLTTEYCWLLTERARRGYQFGYIIGTLDKGFSILWEIIEKQKEAYSNSTLFLSGYLKAVLEQDIELWERTLDRISEDTKLQKKVPELTWRSGMTEKAAKRILLMLENGEIEIDSLSVFQFGGVIQTMSNEAFLSWASFLLKTNSTNGDKLLLNFVHTYYIYKDNKPLNKDLILRTLLQPSLWSGPTPIGRDVMDGYYWKDIALKLIDSFPETRNEIADKIIDSMSSHNGIFSVRTDDLLEVLTEVAKRDPAMIWRKITNCLEDSKQGRFYFIMDWLKGGIGFEQHFSPITIFNVEEIWNWVDKNPDVRGPILAHFVPPILKSNGKSNITREMLARYGEKKRVRDSFSSNYSTECYSGPASVHYLGKKNALIEYRKNENNNNVILWIDEQLEYLESDIEHARMIEEREDLS